MRKAAKLVNKTRTYPRAGDCVSYRLDENGNKVGAHIFRAARAERKTRTPAVVNVRTDHAARYEAMLRLGAIGDQD